MDSLSLLQEIFPTQGSNRGLPHCRQIFFFFFFLPAEPQGKSLSEMIGVRNTDVLLTQCFMGRLEHITKKGTSKRMPENRFFALTCLFGFAPLVSALWNHVDEGNSLLSLSVTEGIITLIIISLLQNCELDQIMENIYSS